MKLVVLTGPDQGLSIELSDVTEIGRDTSADLTLQDERVSWRHVRFSRHDGTVIVEDLGSTNGTYVNSTRVERPTLLALGDAVTLGASTLVLDGAPPPVRPSPPRAIVVEDLVRQFKKGPRAVDGINLHVDAGEIYGFLGPNGAGKTTTVSMLTTLLAPSSGRATVAGFDVRTQGPQVRRSIGAALQEAALDPLLTAREHLILQAGLHGLSKHDARARTEALLHRVGLTAAAERKVRTYSGGMKRRLDLALALVHHPRILFLDEPTTGLDIQSRTALWEEVATLAKDEGVTVFLTTQYLEEADVLADRVGIIDRGRIVAEGTPAELKAEIGRATVEVIPTQPEDHHRVEAILQSFGEPALGTPGAATVRLYGDASALADIVRAMDGEGVRISNLQLHAPTLDDVFLAKTGRSLEGAGQGAGPAS